MKKPSTLDWDNLRYFLELARTGTLAAAARRTGVEHTTVARRIQQLEKRIGSPLFVREAAGHRLTEAGRQLLPSVEAMETAVLGVERIAALDAGSSGPAGLVRVGATEGFGTLILAPHLARLTQKHPHLSIDLLAVPRMLHLSRREADIVISLERPQRGSVIVTRLTDYTLMLYGQREYLARHALITCKEDLREHEFVNYVDDLLFSKELQFLEDVFPPERFTLRSTSIMAQYQAVRAGAGLAVLPAFLADKDPTLARVLPRQARFTRTFWMSMPAEGKHQARIQAVWAFLKEVGQIEAARLNP